MLQNSSWVSYLNIFQTSHPVTALSQRPGKHLGHILLIHFSLLIISHQTMWIPIPVALKCICSWRSYSHVVSCLWTRAAFSISLTLKADIITCCPNCSCIGLLSLFSPSSFMPCPCLKLFSGSLYCFSSQVQSSSLGCKVFLHLGPAELFSLLPYTHLPTQLPPGTSVHPRLPHAFATPCPHLLSPSLILS